MIQIEDKRDCCGCNACGDICPKDAITFKTDNEGFWYPEVNMDRCIDCHLCEKVCPMIHIDELKGNAKGEPKVYGGYNKDVVIRFDSTSGGIFSMLAQAMYKEKGYVSGAIYTEDFNVVNFISNDKKDLKRLRSSKYVESNAEGLYKRIKQLLDAGEKVLACGSPCQMAGLRQYLRKDYDNLIIVDFLCRATNSPKVFRKYLEDLEGRFGGKIIAIKDKNKDHGWHSLARKITFDNGQVYYGEGHEDDYRRGYHNNVFERPCCYECKFKGIPRLSDITLGDFWALNKVDPEMDKDLGTSMIMVNTPKGAAFFEKITPKLEYKEYTLADVLVGNRMPIMGGKLTSPVDRETFFKQLDEKPFHEVAAELFPYREGQLTWKGKLKNILRFFYPDLKHPCQLARDIYWNFFNSHVKGSVAEGKTIRVRSHCAIHLGKGSQIVLGGPLQIGFKRNPASKVETRVLLDPGAVWETGGKVNIYCNCDIQVFKHAKLVMKQVNANMGFQLVCADQIEIGHDTRIGRDVWIRDNNGGHTVIVKGYKNSAPVKIGDGVWICSNNSITKGVTIGDGAIIGANTVVSSNVAAHTMVQGNPAQVVAENVIFRP